MRDGIERDLNESLRLARIAQAREALAKGMSDRDDAELMADAVVEMAHRLASISIEERLLVGAKFDPVGYARHVKELAAYAERFKYISPYDLDDGDALAAIKHL
jgi:hypothetical protein